MKKALIIGINYYGKDFELKGSIRDAEFFKEFLINNYGYQEQNILLLTDNTEIKPTKENIFNGFNWLLSDRNNVFTMLTNKETIESVRNAHLTFYFAGHGAQRIIDRKKREIISSHDEKYILDTEIYDALISKIPETCKLSCVIDACHSGTIVNAPYVLRYNGKDYTLNYNGGEKPQGGEVISIAASEDNQKTVELQTTKDAYGIMTLCLIQILKRERVTYLQLLQNLEKEIQKFNPNQSPVISFGSRFEPRRYVTF
jgi:Caspase domain.